MTISEPHAPIFDQVEAIEQRSDQAVKEILRARSVRPLQVFKDSTGWAWMCLICNWADPSNAGSQSIAFHRAEMHYDVAHAGPFSRSAS